MSGYVLIHRDIIGNPQFRGKDDEYAAIWLITNAAWDVTTVRVGRAVVDLERGQLAYAIDYLARAWECSKSTAHSRLRHFEKIGFIRTEVRTGVTVVTLCKYNEYQDGANAGRTEVRTKSERCPNAVRTNKKERKERKEGKEDSLARAPAYELAPDPAADEFERFWNAYPRQVARGHALKAFRAARKKADMGTIMDGLRRYIERKRGEPPKYIKHPGTWLNAECWADKEPETTTSNRGRHDKQQPLHTNPYIAAAADFFGAGKDAGDADGGRDGEWGICLDLEAVDASGRH